MYSAFVPHFSDHLLERVRNILLAPRLPARQGGEVESVALNEGFVCTLCLDAATLSYGLLLEVHRRPVEHSGQVWLEDKWLTDAPFCWLDKQTGRDKWMKRTGRRKRTAYKRLASLLKFLALSQILKDNKGSWGRLQKLLFSGRKRSRCMCK